MPTIYERLTWEEDLRCKVDPRVKGYIKRDYRNGKGTLKELAVKYDVNYWTVVSIIYPRPTKKNYKQDNTAQVRRLRARKMELGKAIMVPAKMIREYKSLGLDISDAIEDVKEDMNSLD